MIGGAAPELPGVPGEYYGRPTRRLESEYCWLDVLSEGGPRIVGFGLRGRDNILAETPQSSWDLEFGLYELLGGHRLWFAPESAECSVPDSTGLKIAPISEADGPAVRLIGAVEAPTGLRKIEENRLDRGSAGVAIRHVLRNEGERTLELAPWPITQLRLGGVAVLPLPARVKKSGVLPSQLIALWPYASWADERLAIGERWLTVTARPASPFKIGHLNRTGSLGYLRDGLLFVLRFDPALGAVHADMGCNAEVYCDEQTIELESLGPLVRLEPGESTTHDERWELREVGPAFDAAGVAALL